MKIIFSFIIMSAALLLSAAPRPADKTFACSTDLKYNFLPKQKMTFIDGKVKNPGPSALPDADAQYSNKVRVDNLIFTLPGELCETMSACYKADLNQDNVPDYIFVSIKVWNGRFAGQSDVGVFISNPQKKYNFSAFETRHLEAELINGKVMLIKYDVSKDDISLIRQTYFFTPQGYISLHNAEKFVFKY